MSLTVSIIVFALFCWLYYREFVTASKERDRFRDDHANL